MTSNEENSSSVESEEVILPPTSPIQVTFGFELEFAVKSVPDQLLDPEPNDPRRVYGITRPEDYNPNQFLPHLSITKTIEVNGEEVITWPEEWWDQLNALERDIAKVLTDNGFPAVAHDDQASESEDPEIEDLKFWVISTDPTIIQGPGGPFDPYYRWPIEIQSPAYVYNEENKQEVRNVLQIIDETYRTHCELSADVHVHIGNGEKGFDARTVRNFMAFVWTFEEQIATIHPPHYMTENAFSKPVTTHSVLAILAQQYRERLVDDDRREDVQTFDKHFVIDYILGLSTVDEIVANLSSPDLNDDRLTTRLIYSICNLETGMEKIKKTIEFRQHKSTLDGEEIYHWITVCRSLVHFASVADEAKLREFCKEHIHKTPDEFSIVEVLMAIGCPAQAYYYGIRVLTEKRKRDEEELKKIRDEQRMRDQEEEHQRNLEQHRRNLEQRRRDQEEKRKQEEEKRKQEEEKRKQEEEKRRKDLEEQKKKLEQKSQQEEEERREILETHKRDLERKRKQEEEERRLEHELGKLSDIAL